jgi:hypothetical protein
MTRRQVLRAVARFNALPLERLAWPAAVAAMFFLDVVAFVTYCHGLLS